ncbi:MAG TPA: signal peptidase II [Terriglobia bacterium]|nr:signal peptidase II [Terriglobia bacterium]
MPELSVTRPKTASRIAYIAIAALVFIGDQATKAMVEKSIPERDVIPVIPQFFNLTHVKNVGAAFGLFADSPAPWKEDLLIAVAAGLLATVAVIAWRSRQIVWQSGVGLALILGGALSNLVDRIRWGRVTDFLDFYINSYHWYTFNLADSAIVVGAGFLILQVVFSD